ncbi:TonB-dependent receptor [Methylobacillus flagellatus]|uniref:TonB-dependent receptor n=1 Tax=Methylobacillus flagellatus TaxID=405 RepID=UPI0010F89427|nr:TonB-dependent siderophore receptor [Methylobacillus flagellatus]
MSNKTKSSRQFKLKPAVSALALVFGSTVYAEEAATLPVVDVKASKVEETSGYKAERSANQKFTAPLLDTPKTVTVITSDVIQDSGATTFQEALRTTPGITFGAAEGGGAFGDRPFIRGFDVQGSTYVDGVRDLGSQSREIFAIERIEVLKGPSGAFDGRGSAGGSINIVTKQPKAENFVRGSVGLGTDDYMRGTIDVNQKLGDDVAVRLVGMAHDADTPGRDHVTGKRYGFAPSITLGLNSATSATISLYHLETDELPDWGIPYFNNGTSIVGKPLSVDKDNFYGIKDRDFRKTRVDIGTAAIKHEFDNGVVLRNTTRVSSVNNDYVMTRPTVSVADLAAGLVTRSTRGRDTTTQGIANLTDLTVRFDTAALKHTVNTGVEFSDEETDSRSYQTVNGPSADLNNPNANDPSPDSLPALTSTKSRVLSRSAYVFDSIELSKQWILNLGLRYDNYDSNAQSSAAGSPRFSNSKGFFNYQTGIVYKMTPSSSLYASYGTASSPVGSAAGTGNQENGNNVGIGTQDLDPERSKSYELGAKVEVMEDLLLTGALFYTQKTDARVATAVANEFVNAGKIAVKGIELGLAGKITKQWQVFGGYIFMDSELKDGGDQVGNAGTFGTSNEGNEIPTIARNSASLWTTYDLNPKFRVGGGAFYMDRVFANPGNTAYLPSYVRWDAMASYKLDKNLSLQLNVQNLTDERYFNATYTNHGALVAAGRLAFLSLNFNY